MANLFRCGGKQLQEQLLPFELTANDYYVYSILTIPCDGYKSITVSTATAVGFGNLKVQIDGVDVLLNDGTVQLNNAKKVKFGLYWQSGSARAYRAGTVTLKL